MKIKLLIKKIKYKIVKFLYNYFKKIYIRNINIDNNEILQYAHNELTIYGYNKDSKYYNDIIEVIAAISKNNNINSSIKHNISVINKLCNKVPITSLTLKEDEFEQSISSKILYINKRYNKIYKYLNKICFTNAYSISPQYILFTKNTQSVEINETRINILIYKFRDLIQELVQQGILYTGEDVDLVGILDSINAQCIAEFGEDFSPFNISDLKHIKINISYTDTIEELLKNNPDILQHLGKEVFRTEVINATSKDEMKRVINICQTLEQDQPTVGIIVNNQSIQFK